MVVDLPNRLFFILKKKFGDRLKYELDPSFFTGFNLSETFQTDFVATLKAKSDSVRGVNLDQELSDMMLYEQAYAAAARVIGVIQRMFESLEGAL